MDELEYEEQIEAWLVELDRRWLALLAEAEHVLADARADAASLRADGHRDAAELVTTAEARAAEIVAAAEIDARTLLAGAGKLAAMQLADAENDVARIRRAAAQSTEAAQVLAIADAALSRRVSASDLDALGSAVERLRAELSNIVDAAFDALPAVEATAAALRLEDEPQADADADADADIDLPAMPEPK
ncbi:MAG TPA: hypothetical protein VEA78_12155, partial [Acidimicrobiales bacterium]|nr:hypothetical protein [Acidimicrobiales bacterium]